MTVDFDTIRREAAKLKATPAQIDRIAVGAVNDTTRQMRTAASRTIREVYSLPVKQVNGRIHRTSARRGSISSTVSIKDRPLISLSALKPRQRKPGVSYQLKKGQHELIPGAFGPKIEKLHGGVYRRAGKSRLPINKLPGPSLAGLTRDVSLEKPIEQTGRDRLAINIKRRINLLKLRQEKKVK